MSRSIVEAPVVNIRNYTDEDYQCVKFVLLSVLQEWGFLPSALDQQELEALMKHPEVFSAFFVADEPTTVGVVGCAGIRRIDDETCDLRKIYLLQRFRDKGIGKQLLDACVAEAKVQGFKRMRLEVNSAMVSQSWKFYERSGFVPAPEEQPNSSSADKVFYKQL